MIILGVDPGSLVCGWGIVEERGSRLVAIEYGAIKAKNKSDDINERVKTIFLRLNETVKRVKPDLAVYESLYYAKNAQSLMKLTLARAAALLAALVNDVPVMEFSPREIKKAVAGRGGASKEQVMYMTKKILGVENDFEFPDVSDALAAAICGSFRKNLAKTKSETWEDFVKNNPDKIVSR